MQYFNNVTIGFIDWFMIFANFGRNPFQITQKIYIILKNCSSSVHLEKYSMEVS